jgi:hypothetical protein
VTDEPQDVVELPTRRDYDRVGVSPTKNRLLIETVWRRILILAGLIVLVMIVLIWKTEKDSCIRNSGIRLGFNNLANTQAQYIKDGIERAVNIAKAPDATNASKAAARQAIEQGPIILRAQKPVRILDCGGLFPDNK